MYYFFSKLTCTLNTYFISEGHSFSWCRVINKNFNFFCLLNFYLNQLKTYVIYVYRFVKGTLICVYKENLFLLIRGVTSL